VQTNKKETEHFEPWN